MKSFVNLGNRNHRNQSQPIAPLETLSVIESKTKKMLQNTKGLTGGILSSTVKVFPTNRFIHLGVGSKTKRKIKRKVKKTVPNKRVIQ